MGPIFAGVVVLLFTVGINQYRHDTVVLREYRTQVADSLGLTGRQRTWFNDSTFNKLYEKKLKQLGYIRDKHEQRRSIFHKRKVRPLSDSVQTSRRSKERLVPI